MAYTEGTFNCERPTSVELRETWTALAQEQEPPEDAAGLEDVPPDGGYGWVISPGPTNRACIVLTV